MSFSLKSKKNYNSKGGITVLQIKTHPDVCFTYKEIIFNDNIQIAVKKRADIKVISKLEFHRVENTLVYHIYAEQHYMYILYTYSKTCIIR